MFYELIRQFVILGDYVCSSASQLPTRAPPADRLLAIVPVVGACPEVEEQRPSRALGGGPGAGHVPARALVVRNQMRLRDTGDFLG